MFENKKHAFWQAFFVAILVFSIGLVFGIYLEQIRADKINTDFYNSEVSLYDSYALSNLLNFDIISCSELKKTSIEFADKIYQEAIVLERYDGSNKITESVSSIHRKYDLLRTIYWINIIELRKKCSNVNSVVYLYEYETEDVSKIAEQITLSRVLKELKDRNGEDIVLIPIAADQEILSLEALVSEYKISEFPAVIINEKYIFYKTTNVKELESYLNNHSTQTQ